MKATFAGGCFWHMQAAFGSLAGVKKVLAGYSGGEKKNPTYEEVSSGKTGHYESIQVSFDPSEINYEELLQFFWDNIDPADSGGQGADRGPQYRTAIFYHDESQRKLAEKSRSSIEKSIGRQVATQILAFRNFYAAEEYHQDYFRKHNIRCPACERALVMRKDRVSRGARFVKPGRDQLRKMLTPIQYSVTQENGTEPPFRNEYWNNKKEGIYVDVVSGEPLFSSKDKFESGTGWPSFSMPIEPGSVREIKGKSIFDRRTEVRSTIADSHLGHVFDDGPGPSGKRYCMNSAALRFIPEEKLRKEGYGKYSVMFRKRKAMK